MIDRVFDPLWKAKRALNVGSEAVIKQHIRVLDQFSHATIDARRSEYEEKASGSAKEAGTDLISWYLREAQKSGETLSKKYLRDVLLNFIVAGRDTTACLLSWFLYEMMLHPELEAEVLKEINTALEQVGGEEEAWGIQEDPSRYFAATQHMRYTEACLMESLRLHPSVPGDEREAVEDDVLPDGTKVPRGVNVSFGPYMFGRDPGLWPEPTAFRPQRWLDLLGEGSQGSAGLGAAGALHSVVSQYMFPMFSGGPRICLGKTLALMEAKLAVAMLLHRFQFSLVSDHPVQFAVAVTLNMKHGLLCNVQRR